MLFSILKEQSDIMSYENHNEFSEYLIRTFYDSENVNYFETIWRHNSSTYSSQTF